MKPGWQTSEFWISVTGQLLALLALAGAVNGADRDRLETALTNGVTAVFALAGSFTVVWQYVRGRTALKSGPH